MFSFVEDKLVYYKLFFALGSHIDDDVNVQGKIEDGTRDTLEDYLQPEFWTRCMTLHPNGISSSEIIAALYI